MEKQRWVNTESSNSGWHSGGGGLFSQIPTADNNPYKYIFSLRFYPVDTFLFFFFQVYVCV